MPNHPAVRVSIEVARGCGYRQVGGLYLVADAPAWHCDRLPLEVGVCPACGGGVPPARSWRWVEPSKLFERAPACRLLRSDPATCVSCPMSPPGLLDVGRAGLLWVGVEYYKDPSEFLLEAARMGISRRVPHVPKGFVAGQTWVLLAHRCAVLGYDDELRQPTTSPGVFSAFRPTRVEIIVKENAPEREIEGYLKRNLSPVVVREFKQAEMFEAPKGDSKQKLVKEN